MDESRHLLERIERLERTASRVRLVLFVFGAVCASLFLVAWSAPGGYVEATRVIIKDTNGQLRGTFGMTDDGSTIGLDLRDGRGRSRVLMTVEAAGAPIVGVTDGQGGKSIGLNEGMILFSVPGSSGGAHLTAGELKFQSAEGSWTRYLETGIVSMGAGQAPRFGFGWFNPAGAVAELYDNAGKLRWRAPQTK